MLITYLMFNCPIIFLTYKRPNETEKILKIILNLKPKNLYVFQDGKKKGFTREENQNHKDTKSIILKYKKNYSYKSIFYKENISQSLIGYKIIKEVFKKHEKTIILEDDCVPEVGFFRYCDLMLKKFKRNKDIAHISGCNLYYGSKKKKINDKDYFFSKYPQFMGWATWRDRWQKYYDPYLKNWEKERYEFLNNKNLKIGEKRFFTHYLKRFRQKKLITWDIQWVYACIFNNFKTVLPSVNLIKNIGYYNAPTGKGAKKFRNLVTKDIKFPLKHNPNITFSRKYDNFLYEGFYNRKNIFLRVINKIRYSPITKSIKKNLSN